MLQQKKEFVCSGLERKLHSAHFPLLLSQISEKREIEILSLSLVKQT